MRRRVRKIMAFLLAFALVMSAAGSGKLTVLAETSAQETTAETQSQPASQSVETTASDQNSVTPSEPVSEEQPAESEGQTGNDGSGESGGSGESDKQNPPSTENDSTESSSTPTESVTTPTESTTTPTEIGTETESTTEGTTETASEIEKTTEDVTEETTEEETETLTEEETETLMEETTEMETETLTEETTLEETKTEMVLKEQTLVAEVFENSSYSRNASGTTITLKGVMPEGAKVKAYPVNVQIDDEVVLAAYDITIFDSEGDIYQPQDGAIQVKIENTAVREALQQSEEVSVYHMENESASPEEVSSVQTENNAVVFDANSFSVYVVTTPGDKDEHFTHTYVFFADQNGDGTDEEWNRQILSEGEKLNEPETPEKEGCIFEGWYDGETRFEYFGTEEGTLTEDKETRLYAKYTEKVYYVFYKAESSEAGKILYTQKYTDPNAEIVTDGVPFHTENAEQALIGWSKTPGAIEPDQNLHLEGEDVTLYPVVATAHWLFFDSDGGTAVDPMYFMGTEATVRPEDPSRQGYEFAGWFADEKLSEEYTFGKTLSENITLYAKWNPVKSDYTVIYWKENADDEGYTYAEKKEMEGLTGSKATYIELREEHFTLNKEKTDAEEVIITGDGTAVKNVYYDRNEYTIQFRHTICGREEHHHDLNGCVRLFGRWSCGKSEHTHTSSCYEGGNIYTITAKYDSDISRIWSDAAIMEYSNEGYVWQSSKTEKFYSFLQKMPGYDLVLSSTKWEGDDYRWGYYLETLDGKAPDGEQVIVSDGRTYYLYHTITIRGDGISLTYDEDYFPITGFKQRDQDVPEFEFHKTEGYPWNPSGYYTAELFYTREKYDIEFVTNGGPEIPAQEEILYQADISDKAPENYTIGEATKSVDGITYYFTGWYPNEVTSGEPFNFEGQTMPAHDLVLYAGWSSKDVTVSFDTQGGNEIQPQTFAPGQTAKKPEDPVREGYMFAGWTREDGTPFNFNTQITEDITLFAQWISNEEYTIEYNPGAGTGTSFVDKETYAEGAKAKLPSFSADWDWNPPQAHYGFVCWVDGDGREYYPGDWYTMPANDVTLTAKWAPVRETTLTYDFNGGIDEEEQGSFKDKIEIPNEEVQIKDLTIRRDGYTFIGWTTNKNGEGELLQPGDYIQVDTIHPEENILYAQWAEVVEVTVTKQVTGNMGELNQDFSFSYQIYESEGGNPIGERGHFVLSDDDTYVIGNLKAGQYLVVTEESAEGYTTYVNNGEGKEQLTNSFATTIGGSDIFVTFRNDKTSEVPGTGITDNAGASFMMLLFSVAAAFGFTSMVRSRAARRNRFR